MRQLTRRTSMRRISAAFATALAVAGVGTLAMTGPASASTSQVKIDLVLDGPCSDVFIVNICDGANSAAKDLAGADVKLFTTPSTLASPAVEVQNLESAIAQHPAGIVLMDPQPSALDPTIEKVKAAHIPFMIINSGIGEKLGQLQYIGNSETASGTDSGNAFNALGVKHALILSIAPGQVPLVDQRVDAFKKAFHGKVTIIQVPVATLDQPSAQQGDWSAALAKDKSIDGVFSIGSCCTAGMVAAANSAHRNLVRGAIDITTGDIANLKAHQLAFAFDQQPFAQGYWGISEMYQYVKYHVTPVTPDNYTGPFEITPANVGHLVPGQL